jgi:hypothetical protein
MKFEGKCFSEDGDSAEDDVSASVAGTTVLCDNASLMNILYLLMIIKMIVNMVIIMIVELLPGKFRDDFQCICKKFLQ